MKNATLTENSVESSYINAEKDLNTVKNKIRNVREELKSADIT